MQTLRDLAAVDLNHLVAFVALYEARSVTRAGARLGLSQSAVSHVLRHLRERFDDPLFVRVGRDMVPTPRADALIGPVRQGLRALSSALEEPDGFDPATSTRTFRLASVDLFDQLVAPRLAGRVLRAAPGCRVTVLGSTADTLRAVERGEVDAAVRPVLPASEDAPTTGALRQLTLLRDGFSVFARVGHPLAERLSTDLDAYCAARHLLVSPTGAGPGPIDGMLARVGRTRDVAVRLPAFAAALGVISESDLVLTAPASLGRIASDTVVARPPPLSVPAHRITLVWSERLDADPGARWFREQVAAATRGLGA